MIIAVKIQAKADVNGNSRRGWYVHEVTPGEYLNEPPHSEYLGFVDEYSAGHRELQRMVPGALHLCTIDVTPGEFREAKRSQITQPIS
jgi:hypothetical protein